MRESAFWFCNVGGTVAEVSSTPVTIVLPLL